METSNHQLKVGLFSIGLDTYWPQFPGLHDTLVRFTAQVARKLSRARHQLRIGAKTICHL